MELDDFELRVLLELLFELVFELVLALDFLGADFLVSVVVLRRLFDVDVDR